MKRPWHIWLFYGLGLSIVIPAMAWLSFNAIQVDQLRESDRVETEVARQEAELQERINSALYRLDLKLLPLVAQEASRPFYLYEPFYSVPTAVVQDTGGKRSQPQPTRLPSPLLLQVPPFVKLHFQVNAAGQVTSPQLPQGADRDFAQTSCGLTPQTLDAQDDQVKSTRKWFRYDDMILRCEAPAPGQIEQQTDTPNDAQVALVPPPAMPQQSVYSVPAVEKIRQKMQTEMQTAAPSNAPFPGDNKIEQQRSRGKDRNFAEFNRRSESTKDFTGQQWVTNNVFQNQLMGNLLPQQAPLFSAGLSLEGPMQPMWIDQHLVLVRRVDRKSGSVLQVCWLNWDSIQQELQKEVADLLPEVELVPIRDGDEFDLGTALTTLPVQLVVDSPQLLSALAIPSKAEMLRAPSGLTVSLLVAWLGLGLAILASAFLLHGVLKMSERRAAFVSAVTHELRTPLTTFRMYAEMLAEKMVPDEKTQEYAQTLRVQADRLSHLVENVLQFARLERGSQQSSQESIAVGELMDRFSDRLQERTAEAEMELRILLDPDVAQVVLQTEVARVEQILFNLVDNACKYALPSKDRMIELSVDTFGDRLKFQVQDHGPGVDARNRKRMFQPFCKSDQEAANSAPGVGLGLALCRRMAESLGGHLYLEDCRDGSEGACFTLELKR